MLQLTFNPLGVNVNQLSNNPAQMINNDQSSNLTRLLQSGEGLDNCKLFERSYYFLKKIVTFALFSSENFHFQKKASAKMMISAFSLPYRL